MLKSMTGFGRGECTRDGRKFKVELKSVNHRFSDFTIKLPRFLNPMEDRIRARLAQAIVRGKVDIWINFESFTHTDVTISVNEVFADAYMSAYRTLAQRCTDGVLPTEMTLGMLARAPEVISMDRFESALSTDEAREKVWEILETALEAALSHYDKMRIAEGDALTADVREKHAQVMSIITQLKAAAVTALGANAARLHARVQDIIAKINNAQHLDEGRIVTELAIMADKSDINEEITRLESHMAQFATMLDENGAVGRKMDFLVQEMNREANTIGSKSSDVHMTQLVVELKSLIEKIREQVQNIE